MIEKIFHMWVMSSLINIKWYDFTFDGEDIGLVVDDVKSNVVQGRGGESYMRIYNVAHAILNNQYDILNERLHAVEEASYISRNQSQLLDQLVLISKIGYFMNIRINYSQLDVASCYNLRLYTLPDPEVPSCKSESITQKVAECWDGCNSQMHHLLSLTMTLNAMADRYGLYNSKHGEIIWAQRYIDSIFQDTQRVGFFGLGSYTVKANDPLMQMINHKRKFSELFIPAPVCFLRSRGLLMGDINHKRFFNLLSYFSKNICTRDALRQWLTLIIGMKAQLERSFNIHDILDYSELSETAIDINIFLQSPETDLELPWYIWCILIISSTDVSAIPFKLTFDNLERDIQRWIN